MPSYPEAGCIVDGVTVRLHPGPTADLPGEADTHHHLPGYRAQIVKTLVLTFIVMLPVDDEQQGPGDHEEHVERQQNYPRRNTICMLMVGHSENTQVAGFMHDFIKY